MAYPTSSEKKTDPRIKKTIERVQAQLGMRQTDTTEQLSVTRGDAAALGTIALQSAVVTSSPTAADFNKVVADIRALASVLNAMGANITYS